MQVVGVICEYNPFHTGHAWQLAELRRRGAEAIVCAMSGNFVQRGECAIVRKHVRAEAAVRGGADLVLELPLPWAAASAETFARGGVEVLAGTGVVDTLAFGGERADTEAIVRVARCLRSEAYHAGLRRFLDGGMSFAACREAAVRGILGAEDASLLGEPNGNLGVEYCKALGELGSAVEPLALPRVGAAHNGGAGEEYASASYIRERILGKDAAGAPDPFAGFLTPDMLRLYESERTAGRAPVTLQTLERAVLAKLRSMAEEDFAAYDEGNEGLYHRFYDASRMATSVGGLLDAVKTKRYAHARLRRMLLSMWLGAKPLDRPGRVLYLRVLAMNDKGKSLLHDMRKKAALPVLVKPADARKLPDEAQRLMELEARATDLYALAYPDLRQSVGGGEWMTGPVIFEG